jgi:hypothetical protein
MPINLRSLCVSKSSEPSIRRFSIRLSAAMKPSTAEKLAIARPAEARERAGNARRDCQQIQ